ncbi:MAG: alanyl-tRNA editing protein [Candidatus Micrarchaeota archaeon]
MAQTKLLFLEDSYLQEADAKVIESLLDGVVLDQTVFYYTSGGQPCDGGKISKKTESGEKEYEVKEVRKKDGKVIHYLDAGHGLSEGDSVHLKIDWQKRYALMRMHTAAHVLVATMYKNGQIMVTGNQLGADKTRFDFNMQNYDPQFMQKCIAEANEELAKGHEIKSYTLPREEALKIEGIVKLAAALPPSLTRLRIVEIGNLDTQADGGTHVKNTKEAGALQLIKCENKGSQNRRLSFSLSPP